MQKAIILLELLYNGKRQKARKEYKDKYRDIKKIKILKKMLCS
jgi:hypothetical protein